MGWRAGWVLVLGASLGLGAGCLGGEDDAADEETVGSEAGSLEAIEDECSRSDVTWANPADEGAACAAPWTYSKYPVATNAHPLCGTVGCAQFNTCAHWEAQPAAKPTKQFTTLGNCTTDPEGELECEPNWILANTICNDHLAQQSSAFDSPADQRVDSASTSVGLVTWSGRNYTFRCTATINYSRIVTSPHADCGCAVPTYAVCEHAVVEAGPSVRVVTPAGQTKGQVRAAHPGAPPGQLSTAAIQPTCASGEDQPALVPKLQRLLAGMADPLIAAPGTPGFDDLVRRAKVTYELFDAADVAAAGDALHAAAEDLYETHPDVEPDCGRHPADVAEPCDEETGWRLGFCTRLGGAHVGGDLARRVYQTCIDQLGALGDAIEGETCEADDPFVAGSVDAHRRLHEKMLVRFGNALIDAVVNQTADSADALHWIDRWYAEAARALPGSAASAELALVTNKFWQAAHGYKLDAAETGWIDQSLYSDLQARLDDAEGQPAGEAREIVDDAMELTELRGLELDRTVLTAAFADAVPGQPVLSGEPLLRLTADALGPLVERADALVQFHDVGCSLVECAAFATPTKLSRMWKVLASLTSGAGASPSLAQVLAATPGTMAGWKPVFQAIQGGQGRLLAAVAEHADGDYDLLAIVDQARARTASYEASGVFLPAVGDRLYTGVHAAQRARVRDHLEDLQEIMISKRQDIDNRLVSLVEGLVRVRDAETSVAQLEATEQRLLIERDDLSTRAASFRALLASGAAGSESSIFEQLMADWASIEGAIDEQSYLRVEDSADLFLTGADASFDGWEGASVADVGVHKVVVPSKQTLSISTDGVWAPTCALRHARVLDARETPGQVDGAPIALEGALAGPEGYTISWSGSEMRAESAHGSDTDRTTFGGRFEACVASPGVAVSGTGIRACAYVDISNNEEHGTSWQNGSENRTSTQFASGLFLPTTPFEAPAGALVVVEMPPGETDPGAIRDVHLVRGPHTTIAVNGPADLYLAVNDRKDGDCAANDTHELHVGVRRFVGVGDAAKSLLSRMAHAVGLVRAKVPELMARGEVLPSEVTELELSAKLDAIDVPGELQVAVDDYPAPMRDLFYKYLAREMVRLEASVRVANLDREIRIKDAEFRATEISIQNAGMEGYLVSLLPRWTVRGLRLKELRDATSMYASDVRYSLSPLMRVWYPQVLSGLGDVSAVQALTNVDVDQPVLEMTDELLELGTALETRIEGADTPYPSPEDTAPSFVTVRFPQPAVLDPACADSPSARCRRVGEASTFRWATVAQTKALWAAIGQPDDGRTSRRLVFELSPDDIYQVSSGSHYLSCSKSLPVVRRMGLALTGFSASSLPGDHRAVEGTIPATAPMAFVDATGSTSFELANPAWRSLANVPLIYGTSDYGKVKTDFGAIAQDVRGVSPFTTFVFDIPEATVAEWNLRTAKTIDVVLELEAVRAGARVAVPACTAAP